MRPSLLAAASATLLFSSTVLADTTAQSLPFSQNWSNTGLITANDNWSGVPGIEGYLGQDITTAQGADPQTLTSTSAVANDLDVIANQTSTTSSTGGVSEFEITNPAIALQGSGTADAPHIIINLNTIGTTGITVAYVLRDLDGTADNAVQAVALQYRVGNSGAFINIPAGFVADATSGPSLATLVTNVSATLPAGAENQALVQLRIITANAAGSDEWVGIDDLSVTAGTAPLSVSVADVSVNESDTGTVNAVFTVLLNQSAPPGGVSVDVASSDGTATVSDGDYAAVLQSGLLIAQGTSSATVTVTVTGDTRIEANETFTLTLSNPTGGATLSDGVALGTIRNDDFDSATIHAIQGNGSQSARVGEDLATEGIVTAVKNNGFFIQTPAGEADANPLTSQGLFVFTSTAPTADASVGNRVRVFGRVTEFAFSDTTSRALPITQLASNSGASVVLSVTLLSTGNAVPAPTDLQAADLAPGNALEAMERFEGMRVRAPSLVTVAPTNAVLSETNATAADSSGGANGVFFATLAGVPRPLREPGLDPDELVSTTAPGTVPRFDNNTEMLRVDSDAQTGAAKVRADAGATINNLVGVIDYAFNYYTLLPDSGQLAVDAGGYLLGGRSPTAVPDASRDLVTIGGFNLLRFFDDVNDPAVGEPVLTAAALTKRLDQTAEAVCRYVRAPDILGVVEVENLSVLTALANRINSLASTTPALCPYNPQYVARLSEGNDPGGIDVGYLISTREVRAGVPRVAILEVTQLGKDTLFTNPNASTELLNDRPPLLLRATINHANGAAEPVTAIITHMRSLGGVSDTATGSNGWASGGERVRAKRGAQALYLADLVQQRQLADANERLLLLGDFNVFEFNDGLVDGMGIITGREASAAQVLRYVDSPITTPLTVLTPLSPRAEQYSFSFDGNAQSLDHAVVNQRTLDSLLSVKAEHARINSDFSEMRFGTGAVRVSDHDPVVLYLGAAAFRSVDLRSAVTPVAVSVAQGQSLGWSASVTSVTGSDAAPSPSVRLTLNREALNLVVTAPAGWACSAPVAAGGTTESLCTAVTLEAGAVANFGVAIADSTGFALGGVQLTAAAASTGTETVAGDNSANATVTIAGVPGAPTGAAATAGNAQASVAFTAPASNGGSAVTGYTATSSPGAFTSAGCTASPCTVTGLSNGTAYTFSVTATNGAGTGAASLASNSVIPSASAASPIPLLRPDRVIVQENSAAVEISVVANDEISPALATAGVLSIATAPMRGTASVLTRGTASVLDDAIRYTPAANTSGTDSVVYRVCFGGVVPCVESRLSIDVRPLGIAALEFDTSADRGFRDETLAGLRALPSARFEAHGLVAPVVTDAALSDVSDAAAPWGAGRTATVLRTLAAGTAARDWRVLVDARTTTGGDVDLYLGIDSNGNGVADASELVCSSAMSTTERCDLALTAPANGNVRYWALVRSASGGQIARLEIFETALDVPVANRTLVATAPGALAPGESFPVRLSWNDATFLPGQSRGGWLQVRADEGTSLGWVPVRINRTAGEPSAFALESGVDHVLALQEGSAHERLYIDVPPGATQLAVTTTSTGFIDVYLARVPPLAPSASTPMVAAAPPRNLALASGTSPSGNESVVVTNPAAGRWYVTPSNAALAGAANLTVRATVAAVAPVVRAGGYFNPQRSGNGLFLYPAGSELAGLWYTYLQDGSPTWYYLQAAAPGPNGLWRGTIFRSAWNGSSNRLTPVGQATVTPTATGAFTFNYLVDGETGSEAYSNFSGACPTVNGALLDISGHWFDPLRSGTGYSVQSFPDYEFYLVFGYDARGVPRYLVAERSGFGAVNETLTLEQLRGVCPLCTRTGNPARTTVGTLQRRIDGGTLRNITLSATYANGVPGTWAANDAVIPLGGLRGCSAP